MDVNAEISRIFRDLGLEWTLWRDDSTATHRIGSAVYTSDFGVRRYATVYVSDHRQGRGQNVPIGQADPTKLDVRVSTNKRLVDVEDVHIDTLKNTIVAALKEAC